MNNGTALALFFLLVIFCTARAGAQDSRLPEPPAAGLKAVPDTANPTGSAFRVPAAVALFPLPAPPSAGYSMPQPYDVPKAYSFNQLGFFCKWEVELEKATHFPVKFRLGEVQYVEKLEGKLPAY